MENSTATVTALIPKIGYNKASELILIVRTESVSIREAAVKSGFLTEKEFEELITPEAVCKLGN